MSHNAWIGKIATATLLFLGLVVFVFMGRKLRRDFLVAQAEVNRVEAAINESQRPHPRLWSPSPKGFFSDPLMENCCDAIVLEDSSRLQSSLRRGQVRDSGFSSSFFSMAFCWRTASRDGSIRLAPRRIKSEALSG